MQNMAGCFPNKKKIASIKNITSCFPNKEYKSNSYQNKIKHKYFPNINIKAKNKNMNEIQKIEYVNDNYFNIPIDETKTSMNSILANNDLNIESIDNEINDNDNDTNNDNEINDNDTNNDNEINTNNNEINDNDTNNDTDTNIDNNENNTVNNNELDIPMNVVNTIDNINDIYFDIPKIIDTNSDCLENIMNDTIDDSDYMTINNNKDGYTFFNVYRANNKKNTFN